MKKITICGKEYPISCNAFTQIKYRELFKRSIFDDINILNSFLVIQVMKAKELKEKNPDIDDEKIIQTLSSLIIDDMGLFAEAATRIAYIEIYTANEKIESYEEWLKNIPRLSTSDDWIAEVTELAVDCFC